MLTNSDCKIADGKAKYLLEENVSFLQREPFQPPHYSPARPLAKFGHDFPIDVDFHVLMVHRLRTD